MDEIPALSVAEVAARLGQPDFYVFDNNGNGRYKRSHVPGAKNWLAKGNKIQVWALAHNGSRRRDEWLVFDVADRSGEFRLYTNVPDPLAA